TVSLEELESSTLFSSGAPKYGELLLLFSVFFLGKDMQELKSGANSANSAAEQTTVALHVSVRLLHSNNSCHPHQNSTMFFNRCAFIFYVNLDMTYLI
ncbi:MAG: hypothetical protein ACI4MQ_05560, partial [Candidatus Coproplasma sp.]